MKRIATAFFVLAAGLSVSGAALADAKLAQEKACLSCHAVDKKLVGPSAQDIAARYTDAAKFPDRKAVVAKLVEKVKKGGQGTWGPVPMPAQAAVSDADAQKLIEWMLAQKK